MNQALIVGLQSLHLLAAIYWLGSLLFAELMLWPRLRAAGMITEVQTAIWTRGMRRFMAVSVFGTVLAGYARGVVGGVFERLYSAYGVAFVLAAMVGSSMAIWWACSPPKLMKWGWRLWYAGFAVIFVLMVVLRFTG